jgi:hypothetical protein
VNANKDANKFKANLKNNDPGFLCGVLSELVKDTSDGSKMNAVRPMVELVATFLESTSNDTTLTVGKHAIS